MYKHGMGLGFQTKKDGYKKENISQSLFRLKDGYCHNWCIRTVFPGCLVRQPGRVWLHSLGHDLGSNVVEIM